ncbi:MAG TPA: class I SAM-dependent methyltransferase [Bacteroidia bacterium]|nr:class I SAM-dependent methyltransferase [Bacteroidia bacterium]HNS13457.1 class I SAM-dependent methyltransferase [Bacteroidia bacterium]
MDFLDPKIITFSEEFSSPESKVLQDLNRETNAKVLMPRMLSGHLQGRILSMLSHMIQPHKILEIGTYTGYSAICMAEGLAEDGHLYTIDINDELAPLVHQSIVKAEMEKKITTHYGNAIELIPTISGPFDLVFIDADKINYSNYYDLVIDKVKKGGFIIADNVLWSGKVLQEENKMDSDTKALLTFNRKIKTDERVEKVLLPVRDGLFIMRKV